MKRIISAEVNDLKQIMTILSEAGLPTEDITPQNLKDFFNLIDNDEILAIVGLELYDRDGILRSLAVRDHARNLGLGTEMVRYVEKKAMKSGVTCLFILTDTAEDFFKKLQYSNYDRSAVPDAISQSTEFSILCPESAVCMKKDLS
jgi:amino-acid N-acetyltransferase